MAATIIKFDTLSDSIWPATQNHDAFSADVFWRRFVLLFVSRVKIGSVGFELGGASVNRLEGRPNTTVDSFFSNLQVTQVPDCG